MREAHPTCVETPQIARISRTCTRRLACRDNPSSINVAHSGAICRAPILRHLGAFTIIHLIKQYKPVSSRCQYQWPHMLSDCDIVTGGDIFSDGLRRV